MPAIVTATKQSFNTLDDTAATADDAFDAAVQRQLVRNMNSVLADGLAGPYLLDVYDVAASVEEDVTHGLFVNAPVGAWDFLVPRVQGKMPPGSRQLKVRIRAAVAASKTMYVFPVTSRQPFRPALVLGDTGVQSCTDAGAGTAADYGPITVSVRPGPLGRTSFALVAQTTGFTADKSGDTTGIGERWIDDSSQSFSNYTETRALRDPRWLFVCQWAAFGAVDNKGLIYNFDASVPSYTAWTNVDSGLADTVFPVTPAAGDRVLFGWPDAFDGLRLNVSVAGVYGAAAAKWVYWNGTAWADLNTHLADTTTFASTGVKRIFWTPPANWARTTNGGSTRNLFFAAVELTTMTGPITSPQVTTEVVLTRAIGPERVWHGLAADDRGNANARLTTVRPIMAAGIDPTQASYFAGYADRATIHCVHVEAVGTPGIT